MGIGHEILYLCGNENIVCKLTGNLQVPAYLHIIH